MGTIDLRYPDKIGKMYDPVTDTWATPRLQSQFEPDPLSEPMPKVQPHTIKRVGALTVFQEAREQIDEWEKAHPRSEHIVLVLDAPEDLHVTCAGESEKASAVAGLLFAAASVVVE